MAFSITPHQLTTCFQDVFNFRYPDFVVANNLPGGGGYENWALVNFLLYVQYRYGDFNCQREFFVQGTGRTAVRVDLVFNQNMITPETPFILTEWKCGPDHNALSTGCTEDVGKLAQVVQRYATNPPGGVYPLPLVLGIGPDGTPPFAGFTKYGASGGPCLYLSTRATWEAVGVADSTWYAHNIGSEPTAQPGAAPGLVLTAAARSAPMTPSEAGLPDPA